MTGSGTSQPAAPSGPVDVAARLRATASERPEHPALVWAGGQLTYGELHARVDQATGALQHLGVAPGDRVALIAGTTPTFVEVAAAVLRRGATLVPLLPGLAPDELRYVLDDCRANLVVVGPERAADVAAFRDALHQPPLVLAADVEVEGLDRWEDAVAAAPAPDRVERSPDDLAALVYTSGTTGRPRGAMLTRRNLAANQDQSLAGRFHVGPDDVVLLVLPLAHIYSLNVGLGACMTAGATMVLVDRFDPAGTLETIARESVTVVLGAPPMYIAWLESGLLGRTDAEDATDATDAADAADAADAVDTSSLRLAVSGAAPLPVPVLERFAEATGIVIEEGYGLTEAAPSVTSNAMGPAPRPGSVGLPLPDLEVRLVGDDGEDVVRGDPGEVWVRGPNVFQGYWGDDEATRAALMPGGWLRTGDVATQDDDGYLYLVDRLRDLIIVNGFNVYPREVERVLLADHRVGQAAVVGAPHPLTGETVVAHVVPRSDEEVDPDELIAACRASLARYKCPTRVEVVEALPYTATGKVRRRLLRDGDQRELGEADS